MNDGYRFQVVIDRGQVRVFSRNGHDQLVRAASASPAKRYTSRLAKNPASG
jgi:hypothetical protein